MRPPATRSPAKTAQNTYIAERYHGSRWKSKRLEKVLLPIKLYRMALASAISTAAAIKKGFKELVDFSDVGLEFPNSNVVVTDRFLQTQPEVVRRFLMGYAEGIQRYKTDGAFTKRVMAKYLRVQDQTVLDETYQLFAPRIPRIPYPTVNGFRLALESLSDEPRAITARPEEFYDDAILRSLEREGFFQQLYR